ncbi:2-oxo acid dehydrogenase subunit E2 [Gracilinema caldarium]|uniref:2-oxo acid dehydrogenase subunit E2 n=1 Tax=Gracilinema caldarium TaxID=215591 RepID=UPI0026EA693C|nr:2-oxo acid dehydrogenase subunit E2 [Gracilinema caldarium]
MLFLDRCDGKRIKGLNPFQKIIPYVMTTRNGAAVYFSEDIDIEPAMHLVKRLNEEEQTTKYTLFSVVLTAIVRVLEEKPHLNRFVMGKHVYQRNYMSTSFIVKKALTEDARETDAKVYYKAGETLSSVADKVQKAIAAAQSEELSPDEKEMYFLSAIPGGYRAATALFRLLERFNLAPASMIRSDPLYTSVYVANLASLNLPAPYHHLYEWGNASVFVVMGKIERRAVNRKDGTVQQRRFMNFKITLDERISEGLYFARAIDLFRRYMANPTVLCTPALAQKEGVPEAVQEPLPIVAASS